MGIETVIFLGAGASKAEGAPLQGELFKQYFGSEQFKNSTDSMDDIVATFFNEMFGINVRDGGVGEVVFPTFEEVLGLTDLAIVRKENFRTFDIESRVTHNGRLRNVGQSLVFLVAKALNERLRNRARVHRMLVEALHDCGKLQSTAFISTNYDILIDNALTDMHRRAIDLDYGVDFRNFERANDWTRPADKRRVYLLKPHGSLNWLYCPTCNVLEITPKEKSVVTRLITQSISEFADDRCRTCNSVYAPLIVPPTLYKDMTNVFLASIWNRAESVLRKAKQIVFCGYSFPDADMHVKYLLKRGQTNHDIPMNFVVVNNHEGKLKAVRKEEEYRYKRFLGRDRVNYTKLTFEQFAERPQDLLE